VAGIDASLEGTLSEGAKGVVSLLGAGFGIKPGCRANYWCANLLALSRTLGSFRSEPFIVLDGKAAPAVLA
jgi:uncharacterized protein involved in tellurium resistance